MEVGSGTEFRASGMPGKHSTTELYTPTSAVFIEYLNLQKDNRKGNIIFKKQAKIIKQT